ncbi:MAG: HAD-IIB family hydrolase [bacterium]|nr:HAD-IIB family hydrolase [bacterium]
MFTDMDGTLLDHETYSVRGAVSALDLLMRRKVDVVPVTSKTAAEVLRWMRLLILDGPYISENGCGISIPEGFFRDNPDGAELIHGEWKIHLGVEIGQVRAVLEKIAGEVGFQYRSFGQMEASEISALTGLTWEEAQLSRQRDYDEAFFIPMEHEPEKIREAAQKHGFTLLRGGRCYHLTGGCHKGKAVKILSELYRRHKGMVLTIGIGDSANDLPMLEAVDRPFVVQKPDGSYDPDIPAGAAHRVDGIGPKGWRMAIEEIMAGDGKH